jgi:hypothetical protein
VMEMLNLGGFGVFSGTILPHLPLFVNTYFEIGLIHLFPSPVRSLKISCICDNWVYLIHPSFCAGFRGKSMLSITSMSLNREYYECSLEARFRGLYIGLRSEGVRIRSVGGTENFVGSNFASGTTGGDPHICSHEEKNFEKIPKNP